MECWVVLPAQELIVISRQACGIHWMSQPMISCGWYSPGNEITQQQFLDQQNLPVIQHPALDFSGAMAGRPPERDVLTLLILPHGVRLVAEYMLGTLMNCQPGENLPLQ